MPTFNPHLKNLTEPIKMFAQQAKKSKNASYHNLTPKNEITTNKNIGNGNKNEKGGRKNAQKNNPKSKIEMHSQM